MRTKILVSSVLLAACGGGSSGGPPVNPVASPAQAMTAFMKAAADSNLTRMGQLWGSSKGPAAETGQPDNWERRMVVIQAYMTADSSTIVSNMPVQGDDKRRRLIVALYRQGCVKQVPATLTRVREGSWIITEVDLPSAGNPRRPCEGGD